MFLKVVFGEPVRAESFLARSIGTGFIRTFEVPGWPVVSSFEVLISSFFGDTTGFAEILSRISLRMNCKRCLPSFRFYVKGSCTSSSGFSGVFTGFKDFLCLILSFDLSRLSQIKLSEVFSYSSRSLTLRLSSFVYKRSNSTVSCSFGWASPTISNSLCVSSSILSLFCFLRYYKKYSVL